MDRKDIKLSPGFWRTTNGKEAEIVGRSVNKLWVGIITGVGPAAWDERGVNFTYGHDLVAPWREPIRGEALISLRDDGEILCWYTNERAATESGREYVRIRYEEITDGP